MLTCQSCGSLFKPKDRHRNRGIPKYCSRGCLWASRVKSFTYEVVEGGCHKCTSHPIDSRGYITVRRDGITQGAHRYLYKEAHGVSLQSDELVCHICNHKWCINVEHLYQGTKSSNALDAVRVDSWNKKLTREDVRYIKDIWGTSGLTADMLADYFGVTRHAIYHITKKSQNTWSYV